MTLLLNSMLLCNFSDLKSKNLYCSLKSSLISFSLFTSNGKFLTLLPKTSIFSITISISPVGRFSFIVSLLLSLTTPSTDTVDSVGILEISSTSLPVPDVTACVIPVLVSYINKY